MGDDADTLAALAEQALANGTEVEAEARLSVYLEDHPGDVTLLHWAAMLRRALDRRSEAIAALEQARHYAPDSSGLAHALAHVTLEAGRPASALFEQAIRMAPAKAEIRLGLASARFAEGQGERGFAELDAMLAANPGWMEGHRQYAQMAALLGKGDRVLASIDRALARFPQGDDLHRMGIALPLEGERYAEALERADRAIALRGALAPYVLPRAAALDETGRSEEAASLFEALGAPADNGHAVWLARHWLRRGNPEQAAAVIEPWLGQAGAESVWPYAALAWRLAGDPRADWLDGAAGLWKVVDLDPNEIGLVSLRALLQRLHESSGRFLDQSVREGTQTEGALLARTEPEIARVREVLRREVASFAAALPDADPEHPMLSQKRFPRPRFAGSWSVRLTDSGFHAAHHHPQGWISSALYVSVPDGLEGGEGHLELGGAPAGLGIDLPPRTTIMPAEARLVLFPSWMWHGTRPFRAGERMTIAFDIART
ncbi:2OG-Fe(II) oxygenase family protein [Novosphingobium album (ex Hu et al. 2023)]|uniref:2OG-Fe(II) oxygenase n=1 Tax=Novosphingobium album (ex Hu et al. 2023) TaxID=2930093 RepID=A0ABT0AWL8_9SPHN|nr:putative 2OG-Fe(II) oxygenase [Novosphingobium album (ex Hu et al. 2023)]MCJ2177232.1 putative 2OG-Fe(II) oxygenase [Novosphingobium album (ex Hu et al. 2023)]